MAGVLKRVNLALSGLMRLLLSLELAMNLPHRNSVMTRRLARNLTMDRFLLRVMKLLPRQLL